MLFLDVRTRVFNREHFFQAIADPHYEGVGARYAAACMYKRAQQKPDLHNFNIVSSRVYHFHVCMDVFSDSSSCVQILGILF